MGMRHAERNLVSTLSVAVALVSAGLLAGCGGRMPNPTPEVSIFDRYMSCEDIRQEVASNYSRTIRLGP